MIMSSVDNCKEEKKLCGISPEGAGRRGAFPAMEHLLKSLSFSGRVSVVVQNGRVLKSGYEEGFFRQRESGSGLVELTYPAKRAQPDCRQTDCLSYLLVGLLVELTTKKPVDLVRVREIITNPVGNSAKDIATGVIEVAKAGQLASAKYLFEAVGCIRRRNRRRGGRRIIRWHTRF